MIHLVEQVVCIKEVRFKFHPHLLSNRIATGTDAGSDGCCQIFRLRTIFLPHPVDALLDDAGYGASPACMERCHDPFADVCYQHWNAVRCSHAEQDSWYGGYQSVPFEYSLAVGGCEVPF